MRKLANEELNRMSAEELQDAKKAPIVIVLDNIRSMYNVGSVFRTADAFRVEKICLCGITATPPHRDISKTALGSTGSVRWSYYKTAAEAVSELKAEGYRVYAVEQVDNSVALDEFSPAKSHRIAIVFGHEVSGVSEEVLQLVDGCLEIPQYGMKHSFNISVSAGIVIWELFRKLEVKL